MSCYTRKLGLYTRFAVVLVVMCYGCSEPQTLDKPASNGDLADAGTSDSEEVSSGADDTGGVKDTESAKGSVDSTPTTGTGGKVDSTPTAGTATNTDSSSEANAGAGGKGDTAPKANTGAGGKVDSAQKPSRGGNTGSAKPTGTGGQGGSAQTTGAGGQIDSIFPESLGGMIGSILDAITAGSFGLDNATCDPKDSNTLSNCGGANPCCTDDGRCGVSLDNNDCAAFTPPDFSPPDAGIFWGRDGGIWIPNSSD